MQMHKVLFYILTLIFTNCECKSYRNYTLYRGRPLNDDHLMFFFNMSSNFNIKYWIAPSEVFKDVDFIVAPEENDSVLGHARQNNIHLQIVISDLQSAFDRQMTKKYIRRRVETYSWDHYHTLEDTYQWLFDMSEKFTNWVELETIGMSSEGREILALRINRGNKNTKAIVEGGIHGNEWITTEYVTHLASQLILANETNKLTHYLAMQYDWYLIPIVNPDGYVFSQRSDRLWKKNRRVVGKGVGVNLNRNFNFRFGEFSSSLDPTDDEFCGLTPFSEPESKALSEFVSLKQDNLKFYFALHVYGRKIILPYGDSEYVHDSPKIENFCKYTVESGYRLFNIKYQVGTFYSTMGMKISGDSVSWVKKNFNVEYALTFLLQDNWTCGYALPSSDILISCKEMLIMMIRVMTANEELDGTLRSALFGSADILENNWLVYTFWIIVMCSIL